MALSTYGELFDRDLEREIAAGGTVGAICARVRAYERADLAMRAMLFEEWLAEQGFYFPCVRCHRVFRASRKVAENDGVLCAPCEAWQRGYDDAQGARKR